MTDSTSATENNPRQPRLSLGKKIAFSAIVVIAFFTLVELGLRVARIGEPPTVGVLRFGYDTGIPVFDSDGIEREGEPFQEFPLFEADPLLFWRPIANTPFTGQDGLRLDAPETKQKPNGRFRVAVIGDSCSFLGESLYPNRFAAIAKANSGAEVDIVNASCPGYTSLQGVRRLSDVWAWHPDLLIVYFGWNDHWKSLNGLTDREVFERQFVSDRVRSWLGVSRLFWCLYSLRVSLAPPVSDGRAPVRVPPEDYRENLQAILRQAEQHDCRTVFITAPSAFRHQQMPPWAFDFFGQIYKMSGQDVANIPRIHTQYNDIVRSIARSIPTAELLDMERLWGPQVQRHPELFRGDHIHLTETGHQEMAEQLHLLCSKFLTPKTVSQQ